MDLCIIIINAIRVVSLALYYYIMSLGKPDCMPREVPKWAEIGDCVKHGLSVKSHFPYYIKTYHSNHDIHIDNIINTRYCYIISEIALIFFIYWDLSSIYLARGPWSVSAYTRFTHNPLFRYPEGHTIKFAY
jgi:hypothetical protein